MRSKTALAVLRLAEAGDHFHFRIMPDIISASRYSSFRNDDIPVGVIRALRLPVGKPAIRSGARVRSRLGWISLMKSGYFAT